jgi:rhodanese-related sulfurtransferase
MTIQPHLMSPSIPSRLGHHFVLALPALALLLVWPERGQAGEAPSQNRPAEVNAKAADRPAYCGVQNLYRAMQALGVHVSFAELVKPEYISSRNGSSVEDLLRAAKDFRMHAEGRGGMTCAMLSHLDCPVLLHVKSALGRERYSHWVLFMGAEEGQARIYDGTKEVEFMQFEELSARWDGVGLLISTSPINHGTLLLSAIASYTMYIGLGIILIGFGYRLHQRIETKLISTWRAAFAGCFKEAGCLLLLSLLAGVAGRLLFAGGSPSYRPAVAAIQDQHLEDFLPKVSSKQAAKMLAEPAVTFVDSRYPDRSLPEGLPKAIAIRPDLTESQCLEAMGTVPKSNRVVVYWQTRVGKKECSNSLMVARKLIAVGYENVALYEDGLDGWIAFQGSVKD